jgi:hypothetical protein
VGDSRLFSKKNESERKNEKMEELEEKPKQFFWPTFLTNNQFVFWCFDLIWTFFQKFGWYFLSFLILYYILKQPLIDSYNAYLARSRLQAAKDPKRVASLDEERRRIRETQQRDYLIEKEKKEKEEKEEKEKKLEQAEMDAAELRAKGNPTTDATRKRGSFMGPNTGDIRIGGGAYRFGNERRRRP